jgi:hypothetical protein
VQQARLADCICVQVAVPRSRSSCCNQSFSCIVPGELCAAIWASCCTQGPDGADEQERGEAQSLVGRFMDLYT